IPALHNLANNNLLSKDFAVVGISRSKMSNEEFREKIKQELQQYAISEIDPVFWDWFASRLYYTNGDFNDFQAYTELKKVLLQVDKDHGTNGNYLCYLATAPEYFSEIVKQLGVSGLTDELNGQWRRVIIEKPFGHDLDSARQLNQNLRSVLKEKQIYRIDHYLGKETVQNILVFRFSNGIFEPIWNRRYIDHIQITVAEKLGIEQRGGYYEKAGALRDMVPNHIFQLITLTAMEPPISFDADAVRDEQTKILRAIAPISPEEVLNRSVRGQYGEGSYNGESVPGYRSEPDVSPKSITETFVAIKLFIDNWRWAGIPFYLRTGKRLPNRVTEIAIQFKRAPFVLFRKTGVEKLTSNTLVLRIQPDEGISLSFDAKIPGPIVNLGTVNMDFEYEDYFGSMPSTGYERLLYDCMLADATLFQRADMVEAGWNIVEPILDVWNSLKPRNFPNYKAGTWGPNEAHDMLRKDGREWRKSDK
ncbi:MAG: glucose-6-phosphate dehydrogenase, partial [Candidatus Schekmanbacteria bacterium RBG_13_48_7]